MKDPAFSWMIVAEKAQLEEVSYGFSGNSVSWLLFLQKQKMAGRLRSQHQRLLISTISRNSGIVGIKVQPCLAMDRAVWKRGTPIRECWRRERSNWSSSEEKSDLIRLSRHKLSRIFFGLSSKTHEKTGPSALHAGVPSHELCAGLFADG
jgi:hypothetical protein